MPSLQALGEFKASLFNIGGEPQALRELELPRDDLPLPDAEPAAGRDPGGPAARTQGDAEKPLDAFPGTASPGTEPLAGTGEDARGTDFINFGDLGDLLGGMNAPEAGNNGDTPPAGQGDIEFGNFIDSIPDDFSSGEAAADREIPGDDLAPVGGDDFEIPNEDLAPVGTSDGLDLDELTPVGDDSSPGNAEPEQNDFDLPAGLLDGFADEIEAERNSSGNDEPPPDTGTTGAGDNDIGDLDFGDLDFGNQDAGNEGSPGQDLAGEDLSGEGLSGEDLGDFPDFDSNEEADSAGTDLAGEESLDLGSLDIGPLESPEADTGTPAAPGAADSADASAAASPAAEPSGEEDSFDLGGESFDFDTSAVLEEIPSDTFDEFKLDTGAPAEDFNLDGVSDSFGDDFGGHDDFSLPGIDSVFDGKSPPIPAAAPKAAGTTPAEGPAVEEINLTDKELNQFEKTLSSYPLNLRIACEELIAEQAVDPGQMSLLVKLLVNGAPAGETAELAGKLLGRNISIPKGFEKKTGEALEAEQSSFAYIFIHNFLPVLRLFMIIALALLSL
ncbi:MAG: hypothetical protein FWC45_09200, partial [Treponema sp.]|nr:hypothetical protein [Treponema sp.]